MSRLRKIGGVTWDPDTGDTTYLDAQGDTFVPTDAEVAAYEAKRRKDMERVAEAHRAKEAARQAAQDVEAVRRETDDQYLRMVGRQRAKERFEAENNPPGDDWLSVDLSEFWDTDPVSADVGWRSDGVAMFYRAEVNTVFGESASGKSWIALIACVDVLRRSGSVVYFDAEDGPHPIAQRLKALGASPDDLARFTYVRPSGWSIAGRDLQANAVRAADLVVVDATTEFLAAMGLSSNSDTDVARFMEWLPKWAARLGPAVVVIDHTAKDSGNRNGPVGSQHKRSAVDGAAYYVHPVHMLKRNGEGLSRVYVNKDKQGGVGAHTVHTSHGELFADLRADAEGGGFRLDVPTVPADVDLSPEEKERAKIEAVKVKITSALAEWSAEKPPGSGRAVSMFLRERGVSVRNGDVSKPLLDSLVASGHLTEGYGFKAVYAAGDSEINAGEEDGDGY